MAGCGQAKAPAVQATASSPAPAPLPAAEPSGRMLRWSSPPPMTINPQRHYTAVIRTTVGSFTVDLFARQDPVAVNNFVFLARHRFFVGDTFFRVVKNFVVQTGDPLNQGTGGPGYQWAGELPPPFPYGPGIVAMANTGNPNTNGSQFFICTGPESQSLNQTPIYTELGRVTQGWATVERIADGSVVQNPVMGGELSKPVHPVTILSVTIHSQ
ncbi:MAG: peptidylprolyl isomerase [Firmicutes bacterium]|nr:peptidylprolyl isomerase [Alicyclobacillaceae bacterium]MCL6498214.1 peptidylprolyl isomerase [Bacillota bacterium]